MEHNHLDITKAPIGVFDSGLGGLSVLREMIKVMPYEDMYYFGDCFCDHSDRGCKVYCFYRDPIYAPVLRDSAVVGS